MVRPVSGPFTGSVRAVSAAWTIAHRRTARAHDEAGPRIDDVLLLEAGVADRLFHGDKGVGRPIAHEAARTPVDRCVEINLRTPVHLAAESHLLVIFGRGNAGLGFAQRADRLPASCFRSRKQFQAPSPRHVSCSSPLRPMAAWTRPRVRKRVRSAACYAGWGAASVKRPTRKSFASKAVLPSTVMIPSPIPSTSLRMITRLRSMM